MDLRSWLDTNRDVEYQEVTRIRAASNRVWAVPLHRYYTDHSVAHSDRVIEKLSALVPDATASGFSPLEIYILLASAYLHDIGMQHEQYKNGDLEQIRNQHQEITRQIILENYLSHNRQALPLGLEGVPADIVNAIALVAEAHRKTDLSQHKYRRFFHGDKAIRPQLLAALLRLADELDLDHRRVYMESLYFMDVPDVSRLHWHFCYYVSGVEIEDGLVTIWYRFPQESTGYPRIIRPLVNHRVQTELRQLQPILWTHGVKITTEPRDEMQFMPGLELMSSQVEQLARDQCRGRYEDEIVQYSEEIRLLDSFDPTYQPDLENIYE